MIGRGQHRRDDDRQGEGIDPHEIALSRVRDAQDQPSDGAIDGRSGEVERAVLPELRPEGHRRLGLAKGIHRPELHPRGHRCQRDGEPTLLRRRELVQIGKDVRKCRPAELHQFVGPERRDRVTAGDVMSRRLGANPHVLRLGIEERRQIEEALAPFFLQLVVGHRVPDHEFGRPLRQIHGGVREQRCHQEDDQAHPEQRGDRPEDASKRVANHRRMALVSSSTIARTACSEEKCGSRGLLAEATVASSCGVRQARSGPRRPRRAGSLPNAAPRDTRE